MFKIIIFTCFLLLELNPIKAQGFNKYIKPDSLKHIEFENIEINKDTIITYGTGIIKIKNKYRQGIYFSQIDTMGNIINARLILDSLYSLSSNVTNYGNFILNKRNQYIGICSVFETEEVFLFCLDKNLNLLWSKKIQDPSYFSNFDYKIAEIEGGYVLYGEIQWLPKQGQQFGLVSGFIRKIDENGNSVWVKYYNPSNYINDIIDFRIINDSTYTFLLNSELKSSDADDPVVFNSLYLIDNQGNTIKNWQTNQKDTKFYYVDKIVDVIDENIIVFGHRFIDFYYLKDRNFRPYVAAFDAKSLSLKWQKDIGIKSNANFINNGFWDFTKTIDNNYVGVGNLGHSDYLVSNEGVYTAWLNKFSTKGEDIWSRSIAYPFNIPDTIKKKNFGYLLSVATLSSGSIIAAGKVDVGNDTYGYLVKMTNDGCLDTLFKCDNIIEVKDIVVIDNEELVKIFPNPAQDIVNIKFKVNEIGYKLIIRNLQGNIINDMDIPPHLSSFEVVTNSLANGIYIFELKYSKEKSVFHKVIILK
jgi:hypothetical protein